MRLRNLILLILVVVFGALALIAFLTVPDERLATDVFKLSFIFAIPLNLLIALGSLFYVFRRNKNTLARIPAALLPVPAFSLVMLITGFIFMYAKTEKLTAPIIVFVIEIILYSLISTIVLGGVKFVESSEKQVKKKTSYIKLLEADILDCVSAATHEESRSALKAFAENVRFSDPMSHKSLVKTETQITSYVHHISKELTKNPAADVTESVKAAEALLCSRNNRCKILK